MTADLVQFLRARLDDDEHWALTVSLASSPETWEPDHENGAVLTVTGKQVATGTRHSINDIEHIARHDPARVLREVAAKRLMLDEALASRHLVTGDQYMDCPLVTETDGATADQVERIQALNDQHREELGREPSCIETCGRDARVHRTLELMALPYVDHPDYMQALTADQA